ncbi:hypothetical protein [Leucobacter sp.]
MRRGRGRCGRIVTVSAALLLGLGLQGCGLTVPTDPDGTLEGVRGGTLRVGLSPEPGLVEVSGGEPSGALIDLVEDFARRIDATPEWTVRGEEGIVGMLEEGELDLAVGGFTDGTPWSDRVGVSRGYPGVPGSDGRALVVFVPLGENAFLTELERFLDEEAGS